MKKSFFTTMLISAMCLLAGCKTNPDLKNAELKNKWVDDNDTIPITYTFSDNETGDITLEFEIIKDCVITGSFKVSEKNTLHFSLTNAKFGDKDYTMNELEVYAKTLKITLPVTSEMDFDYSINASALTLTNKKDNSVRNCTLAFTEKDLVGSWKLDYKYYSSSFQNSAEKDRVYTFFSDKTANYKYTSGSDVIVATGTWSLENNILNFEISSGTKNDAAMDDIDSLKSDISFNNKKISAKKNAFYTTGTNIAVEAIYKKISKDKTIEPSEKDLIGNWRTSEKTGFLAATDNFYYTFKKGNQVEFKVNDKQYKGEWFISNGALTINQVKEYSSENNTWTDNSSLNQLWTVSLCQSILEFNNNGKTRKLVRR